MEARVLAFVNKQLDAKVTEIAELKSGILLLKLLGKKHHTSTLSFKQMDNIHAFIKEMEKLGLKTFEVMDLYKEFNIPKVCSSLLDLEKHFSSIRSPTSVVAPHPTFAPSKESSQPSTELEKSSSCTISDARLLLVEEGSQYHPPASAEVATPFETVPREQKDKVNPAESAQVTTHEAIPAVEQTHVEVLPLESAQETPKNVHIETQIIAATNEVKPEAKLTSKRAVEIPSSLIKTANSVGTVLEVCAPEAGDIMTVSTRMERTEPLTCEKDASENNMIQASSSATRWDTGLYQVEAKAVNHALNSQNPYDAKPELNVSTGDTNCAAPKSRKTHQPLSINPHQKASSTLSPRISDIVEPMGLKAFVEMHVIRAKPGKVVKFGSSQGKDFTLQKLKEFGYSIHV